MKVTDKSIESPSLDKLCRYIRGPIGRRKVLDKTSTSRKDRLTALDYANQAGKDIDVLTGGPPCQKLCPANAKSKVRLQV